MRRTIRGLLTTCTAALLWLASPAGAQQLLPNSTLDSGLAGFTGCCDIHGTVEFDFTRDANGWDLSGSAEIQHYDFFGGYFITRCVSGPAAQAGKALFFGARIRFREGEPTDTDGYVVVEFYPDDACAGNRLDSVQTSVPGDAQPRGTWLPIALGSPAKGVTLPPGTHSIRYAVGAYTDQSSSFTVNVDDVFAAPVGTPLCDGMPATIIGTSKDEFINGTESSDVIVGRGGIDWIDGKGGNDRLCGGPGADVLYGGKGNDRLFGGGGGDQLFGAEDADVLNGEGGNDTLDGGDGSDRLKGGSGKDDCTGGPAVDVTKGCETTRN
jgi:hypothetical protein